jgi:hypothetical protein|tara:strand:+ start:375 stop:542 length:168 start_codon:yes stop_codon:yes gene_type:complete
MDKLALLYPLDCLLIGHIGVSANKLQVGSLSLVLSAETPPAPLYPPDLERKILPN